MVTGLLLPSDAIEYFVEAMLAQVRCLGRGMMTTSVNLPQSRLAVCDILSFDRANGGISRS